MGRYSRVIKNICRMLDVEYTDSLVIKCPACKEKGLVLKSNDSKARCKECGLEWKMRELEIIMEGEFDYKKREISYIMTEKKGVPL
ncbi:hypothetical protein [Sporohalobacter salinus]|uniref:hypothetical protein n=1 Tax=Sporohalobacter salinus TaxID=1494606 RepID=UPI0019605FC0|nr:hypothetical protein [Sporohalobacter salinus]MBM7623731.1 ribosomal protein S27E [Sporohalobacter salinus]